MGGRRERGREGERERDMRVTIVVGLVTVFLVFCGYVVEGRDLWEEDLILETELKTINKPAVKTIEVRNTKEEWNIFHMYDYNMFE